MPNQMMTWLNTCLALKSTGRGMGCSIEDVLCWYEGSRQIFLFYHDSPQNFGMPLRWNSHNHKCVQINFCVHTNAEINMYI